MILSNVFLRYWAILNLKNDPYDPHLELKCAFDGYITKILDKIYDDP